MRYIKGFFRGLWLVLDGLRKTLHLLLLLLIFGLVLFAASPTVPLVPASAVLIVAPQGDLVEQLSGGPLDRAFAEVSEEQQTETRVRDLVDAIELAKDDKRIKALYLDLDQLNSGGVAKLEEVAAAVRDFRTSGKPVLAFGTSYSQGQYYLAAHADQVFLDPHGEVIVDGFAYYRQFYKDAIDKLGVNVNIFKAGKYKSYVEQFTRSDMSAEDRESGMQWMGSLWSTYQTAVTKSRGLEQDALQRYADQILPALKGTEGDAARLALEKRLVTDLKTREEVEKQLTDLAGEDADAHTFNGVDSYEYLIAHEAEHPLEHRGKPKVGIVVAAGEIVDGERHAGMVGGDSMVELLKQARHDDDIKAVVLRIDSPGGSVVASELIRREVAALKAAGKPVVASMSSTAASGGYYIAMDADEIWASPATITGSIGVFAIVPTFERSLAKLGINSDGFGTTSIAGATSLERALSDTEKGVLQLSVEHEYASFVNHAAQARNKSFEQIDSLAQGRVWAADDAQRQGLVDHLGLLDDAIEAAAERAHLGDDFQEKYLEAELSWRQVLAREVNATSLRMVRMLAPETSLLQGMRRVLSPLQQELERLDRNARGEAMYYCACTVE